MKETLMEVDSGNHIRLSSPISADLGGDVNNRRLSLVDESDKEICCQVENDRIWFVLPKLITGEKRGFRLRRDVESSCFNGKIQVEREDETLKITLDKKPVLTYHYGNDLIRPFFFPVIGPDEIKMTRSWPIVKAVEGESTDHVHHKSFWVSHGLVNGSDHWSESTGYGKQVHTDFEWIGGGCIFGGFVEKLDWLSAKGDRILSETRSFRLWNVSDSIRLMDLALEFTAASSEVVFGDTKEGGLCSFRVAEFIKGERGGIIENAYGAVGEAECWGKRAPWVDYSGKIGDQRVGIAVMDYPFNPRYPTYWHVRDYGLFSANPFGLSYFKSTFEQQGDWVLHPGESVKFQYRIALHTGNAQEANIVDRFNDLVNPPVVTLIQ